MWGIAALMYSAGSGFCWASALPLPFKLRLSRLSQHVANPIRERLVFAFARGLREFWLTCGHQAGLIPSEDGSAFQFVCCFMKGDISQKLSPGIHCGLNGDGLNQKLREYVQGVEQVDIEPKNSVWVRQKRNPDMPHIFSRDLEASDVDVGALRKF